LNLPGHREADMSKTEKIIRIEQIGSPIRRHHSQRQTLIGLGLNRIGRVAEVPDTPQTRGMLAKVKHLIRVMNDRADETQERARTVR
jgi:large subunit ribosomal protein L30